MTRARWWSVAFLGTAAVLLAIALATWPGGAADRWGLILTTAALAAAWLLLGRRAEGHPVRTAAFLAVLTIACGVLTALNPVMATMQAVALPTMWVMVEAVRRAIAGNVAIVAAVGVGFVAGSDGSVAAIVQALVIEGLSLAFSIALGLWITNIAEYGHERGRLLDELRAAQDALAVASRDAGAVGEREHLSREIHDTIAQSLTSLVLVAQRARVELGRDDAAATSDSLDLIESTARDALTEARGLVASLAPIPADGRTLGDVVARLASRFSRETAIPIDVDVAVGDLPRDLEVVLLRCTQEGLANVRKHAGATSVRLAIRREGGGVLLEVCDDGRGVDAAASALSDGDAGGFGVAGMRDRVGLVGGTVELTGAAGSGSTLLVRLPVPDLSREEGSATARPVASRVTDPATA